MMRNRILLSFVLSFFILISCFITSMNRYEQANRDVDIQGNQSKVIVFYRDDCAACQKVFPILYVRNLLLNDLLFVNMNSEQNRHYVEEYSLRTVPTFIKGSRMYRGTDLKKIVQFLQQ